ncbi:glycosyltransferase family 4 protein [Microbacterium sp. H1-D42]|uniref:glycosyltransferase family 4 protein n=1 Tax=Microbacterium sp. H1-D42 TaxID=2925844 RepID=UPI001F531612|nr:glycosyltransferase family 4 protein [Microbacterium sp. H1-D42]UNK70151.1 glycosyltransferase family 4 protein [Microbacterium sp. H1-D42]
MADPTAHRVALITSSFAPHFGGVEEHVAQVARHLHSRGHIVEVWTVDRGSAPQHPFLAADGSEIPVRYLHTPLPARSLPAMLRFAARWPTAWGSWRRAHRRLKPDVLHVHCFGPNGVYADALHHKHGTPLVITSHGETVADDNGIYVRSAFLRSRLRRALASADAVTAPSEFVLADLRAKYALAHGEVVPNGVDLEVAPATVPLDGEYLFAVGRLGAAKGFDLLIDAFARARPEGINLLIGGDGPERDALEQRAKQAGLGAVVSFLGRLSPAEVDAYMRAATAVVVPSRSEAFGIVALEAWRASAPLVMTSRGGAGEFVRDGEDGLLVDPTDLSALADVLIRVSSEPTLRRRIGARGRERVKYFRWQSVARGYEALYEAIAPGGKR